MTPLNSIAVLLLNTLGSLYLLAVLLRLLLQLARADFYNPITQIIVRITDPAVKLFRRVIPNLGSFDLATLVFAFLLQVVGMYALVFLYGIPAQSITLVATWAAASLLGFVLNIYFVALIISIVASFLAPFSGHPALVLVRQITEPVMAPFRRLLPPMGGLDLSPIFVFLTIQIIRVLIVYPVGVNPQFVLGW